jgi:hypothetical protein
MDATKPKAILQPVINVTALPEALQKVFIVAAAQVAEETECIKRVREFDGPTLLQTFTFGFMADPKANSETLAQTAAQLQILVTASAIDQQLDKPSVAAALKQLIEKAVETVVIGQEADIEVLNRFSGVYLLDSSSVTMPDALEGEWSGCGTNSPQGGKAALKIQTRVDIVGGQLLLHLTPGRDCDQKAELRLVDIQPGSLHLRDLGYFDLDVFEKILEKQAYFLSRLMHGTIVHELDGQRLNLLEFLKNRDEVDCEVLVGKHKKLRLRLLARRLPQEVADERRRKYQKKCRDKGTTPSDEATQLRGWCIYVTNVPPAQMNFDEAGALMRQRWQIELLFKLWKSKGKLTDTDRIKPQRILAEVYAKLLAMIVQHWGLVYALWMKGDRSLTKGAKAVRATALMLMRQLHSLVGLKEELDRLREILQKTARVQPRKKKPAAFQVIDDPSTYGYRH